MAGPKLADYLEIRERELESQVSNVRGQLAPLEAELAQVRKIRSLIADARAAGLDDLASDALLPDPPAQSPLEQVAQAIQPAVSQLLAAAQAETLTIKEMILRALRDHFENGASPTELRDYMRAAFGKEVDRNSISPQLARLREEGMVDMLNDGKWKLSRQGIGIMRYSDIGQPVARRLRDLK
jgi:DNA-binding transcriptional ArsR family regulator